MKKTILRILKLKLPDGCGLAMRCHTDHVMPAQYLMKHDPVRKATEPQAENNACPNQWMFHTGCPIQATRLAASA